MKWIGTQTIYDHVRLVKGITLDSVSITTIQSSGESFADNDTSLMTSAAVDDRINTAVTAEDLDLTADSGTAAVDLNSQALAVTGGTNATTSATGQAVTINVDDAFIKNNADDATTGTITSNGLIVSGDKSVTPGDGAMIHLDGGGQTITDSNTSGSGTAAKYTHVNIESTRLAATNSSVTTTNAASLYISGAPAAHTNQTITNAYALWVDAGASKFDGGIIGDVTGDVTGNCSGTAATVTGAAQTSITTLTGLTSFGTAGATTNIVAGDLTMYNVVNDGNPTISLGSTANERLEIKAEYESGAQGLDLVKFITHTAGSGSDDGRYAFQVDETFIFNILDAGVRIKASGNLEIGSGNAILSDSGGTTTLSNIDALDTATRATINSAQKQMTYYMFRADIDTTKTYVGLQEADGESSSATNKNLPILAPLAGKLLKVFLRANSDLSGKTLTWRLETIAAGTATSGTPSVVGTQSGAGCTASSMTTYDFTSSLDSGDNIIDAGDTVQLSIQSDGATSNTTYYVTCLSEWDFSSIGS